MVQQINEFESLIDVGKGEEEEEEEEGLSHRTVASVYQGQSSVSTSTTMTTSSNKSSCLTNVTEQLTETVSEVESAEDSEKTQTSDADSDRHHGATDSGGNITQEESKGELSQL